jgi:hypothetical protein
MPAPRLRWAALACGIVAASAVSAASMRDCVERGGVYLEDGTCEMPDDDAARRCRERGGRYRSSGRCEVVEQDPEERCRESGGVGMHEGKCYRLRTRDDPPPGD